MNKLARYIIIVAVIAIIVFVAWYFSNIIIYILISAVLSIIGRPIVVFFDKLSIGRIKCPHWLSAVLSLSTICFVAFMFFYTLLPLVSEQLKELSQVNVPELTSRLTEPFAGLEKSIQQNVPGGEYFSFKEAFSDKITSYFDFSKVTDFFGSVANLIISLSIAIFCIFFITFFFLKEDRLFSNGILMLVPQKYEKNVIRAMESTNKLLIRYFVGILIEILCMMIVIAVGLTLICGIKFSTAIVIALFAGVLNVIPYVGPLVGGIFGVLVATATNATFLATGNIEIAVPTICVFVAAQLIDNIVLQPVIYSNSVKSHPLEIFIVLLIAGNIAGIFGMLIAIPTYTVIRVFAKEFLYNFKFIQKLTENI